MAARLSSCVPAEFQLPRQNEPRAAGCPTRGSAPCQVKFGTDGAQMFPHPRHCDHIPCPLRWQCDGGVTISAIQTRRLFEA